MSSFAPTAPDGMVYLLLDPPEGLVPGATATAPTGTDLSASSLVGGLPLLVRLLRQLGRAGAGPVALVTAGAGEGWLALLARYRQAGQPAVALVTPERVPAAALRLEAAAVYAAADLEAAFQSGQAPAPRVRVTDAASRVAAERFLWASIRKTIAHDGPVAYFLARPLSTRLSRLLLPTGIAPNAVTGVGLGVGIASGLVAALGGYGAVVAATALFFLGMVLDCVDGELARITLGTSRLGQWLDTLTDDLSVVALTVGLGFGLARETGAPGWLWAGVGAGGLVVLGQALIYLELVRAGGPIDTARYPWFFSGGAGLAQEGPRSLVGYLSFAFRRDALTLLFFLLALLGFQAPILVILAGGGALYFLLLLVDRVVKGFARMQRPA